MIANYKISLKVYFWIKNYQNGGYMACNLTYFRRYLKCRIFTHLSIKEDIYLIKYLLTTVSNCFVHIGAHQSKVINPILVRQKKAFKAILCLTMSF